MTGYGPYAAAADGEEDQDARNQADLSVNDRQYFGAPLGQIDAFGSLPISPSDPRQPVRHSYVYQAVFEIGNTPNGESEFGGIQLRARLYTYRQSLSMELQTWLTEAAHRSAHMFNSRIEADYVNGSGIRGTDGGSGFLDGFDPYEEYKNHEHEPVEEVETQPGVIDWSVEIYEDDSFDYAELSGIAQGVANPYRLLRDEEPGEPSVDVVPTKWEITYNPTKDGGRYDVHPKGDTNARKRYQTGAGRGKTIYINRKPVGSLDQEGRAWLAPEYAGDPHTTKGSFGTYWSREGLVDTTDATYQALSRNGRLYQTGETESAVYLVTAREKPEGWSEGDPDNVSTTVEAKAGTPGTTYIELKLADPDLDGMPSECRRDDRIIRFMGRSDPRYSHVLSKEQRWEANASKL